MTIGRVINDYGKIHSPYIRGLVNHLPMGQLALYKLTGELEKVKSYSECYNKMDKISLVKKEYPKKDSLEECLGERKLYESCLDIIKEKAENMELENLISEVLNKYILGMSSGLFHTLIRLAYGVEGYKIDKEFYEEIQRALAYYITAYRQADLFERKINGQNIIAEIKKLSNNIHIHNLISDKETLGQRLRALYEDESYLRELGFIIEGEPEEKIRSLIKLLIPAYYNSGNIVVLHCITGLHALIVLEKYFEDFSKAIDIFTTCIITHILAADIKDYESPIQDTTQLSWGCLKNKASVLTDVHAIKLTYTSFELDKMYNIIGLKDIALKRIRHM